MALSVKRIGRVQVEFRQLRHFVTLAEELHFGRAAKRLSMTQPPLSLSIHHLEERWGIKLFDRNSKRVVLTPVGAAMLQKARELLLYAQQTQEYADRLAQGKGGNLQIGFSAAMLLYRGLASVFADFATAHPEIDLSLREASSQEQRDLVYAGRLDAGFVNLPHAPQELESVLMVEEYMMACLPGRHPLSRKATIALSELRDEPFVLMAERAARPTYLHAMAMCDAAGFHPKVALEVVSMLSIVALVAHGFGVAVLPESMRQAGIPGAKFVRLKGMRPQPTVYLVWHRNRIAAGLLALIKAVQDASICSRLSPKDRDTLRSRVLR